jgi:hypothetical protein
VIILKREVGIVSHEKEATRRQAVIHAFGVKLRACVRLGRDGKS